MRDDAQSLALHTTRHVPCTCRSRFSAEIVLAAAAGSATMPWSAARRALNALLATMQYLARVYGTRVSLTHESPPAEIRRTYRRLSVKCHPDKGGRLTHQQQLNAAHSAWEAVHSGGKGPGRPRTGETVMQKPAAAAAPATASVLDAAPRRGERGYRIHATGVLLTYQAFPGKEAWPDFLATLRSLVQPLKVKYWCATLETNVRGNGGFHAHVMVQFKSRPDMSIHAFRFGDLRPRADTTDALGEAWGGRKAQKSMDRAFFYVWADKIGTARTAEGTICVDGNYVPAWSPGPSAYTVEARWIDALWRAHKLTHERYGQYVARCRQGVIPRKRNLDAVVEAEAAEAADKDMLARIDRIRNNPDIYTPFPEHPQAAEWLKQFRRDALRYSVLVVLGPSRAGKTEWAQSLFKNPLKLNIGSLTHFPDGMRAFDRATHDALVLDDVRDLQFLVDHQDKLQGKYNARVEFASTPGGQCSYSKDLFAVPIVVTCNYTTKNLQYLEGNDYWGNRGNREVVFYAPPGGFDP